MYLSILIHSPSFFRPCFKVYQGGCTKASGNDFAFWQLMELVDNEVDAPPNTLDEIICLNAVKDSVAGKPLLQK